MIHGKVFRNVSPDCIKFLQSQQKPSLKKYKDKTHLVNQKWRKNGTRRQKNGLRHIEKKMDIILHTEAN